MTAVPLKVLIVDDNPDDRSNVRQLLLSGSDRLYSFREADRGDTAIGICGDPAVGLLDCVILDYNLPDMDGVDVITALRGSSRLPPYPVLILTGFDACDGNALLRAGAQDFIGKGWITARGLTRAVENAMERFRMMRDLVETEERLRKSEEHLRISRQMTSWIAFEWDIKRNEVRRFHSLDPVLAPTPESAPSTLEAVCEMVHPGDREVFMTSVRSALGRHDGRYENEYRVRHPEGKEAWLYETGRVLKDADGAPALLIGISLNATERKVRELNIAFLAEVQKRISNASQLGSLIEEISARITAHLGVSHCVLCEVSEAGDVGRSLYDSHRPREAAIDGVYRLADYHTVPELDDMKAGKTIAVDDVALAPNYTPAARKRYEELQVRAYANAAFLSDGRLKFVLSGLHKHPHGWTRSEIELLAELAARIFPWVERIRAEASARENEAKARARQAELEALMDAIPAAVFIAHDASCERLTGSRATREILRLEAGGSNEVPPRPDFTVWHANRRLTPDEFPVQRVVATGQPLDDTELQITFNDGQSRFLLGNARPILDAAGEVAGGIGAFIDITARKRAEQQLVEARLELQRQADILETTVTERTAELCEMVVELEAFSYCIAHDMRAPLRAMQGYAEVLSTEHAGQLDAVGHRYLQRIAKAAARLDEFILDILNYGRIVREQLVLRPIELESLIDDLIDSYPVLNRHQAAIMVQRPLPRVRGHASALAQVLANLLENAIKFVPPGRSPLVRVRAESKGEVVRVWVEDNGLGIPPEFHGKLFNLFTRLHPDAQYEGTGVGLAVVRKSVERMGGTVGVESVVGAGSRFWFELNRADDT